MRLRLLSLNAWALMPPLGTEVLPRMRAIGDALPRLAPDLAAFQEIWQEPARDALLEAGRRAGLVHAWQAPGASGDGGLLVLSRRPIRTPRFEPFELGGHPEAIAHADYWGGKGFAELGLETPVGELRVLVTHLHAAYAERARDVYVGHRVGQVLQLVERIQEIEGPLLLAGDLNFRESYEEHAILGGLTGAEDVAAVLDARQPTVLAANPYRRGDVDRDARIDYVFVRDGQRERAVPIGLRTVLDGPRPGDGAKGPYSDHAGLIADFELRAEPGAAPPPELARLETARALLLAARADAVQRRDRQRATAGAGLALAPAAWFARRSAPLTRRTLLRSGVSLVALLAAGTGTASLARAELLRAHELAAYDAALGRADRLADALTRPPAPRRNASRGAR